MIDLQTYSVRDRMLLSFSMPFDTGHDRAGNYMGPYVAGLVYFSCGRITGVSTGHIGAYFMANEIERKHGGFTIIYDRVLEDSRLRRNDILVYVALCKHADKERKAFPSISTIARVGRIAKSTVQESLKHMQALGYLSKQHRVRNNGSKSSNRYYLDEIGPGDIPETDIGYTGERHSPIPESGNLLNYIHSELDSSNKPMSVSKPNGHNAEVIEATKNVITYLNEKAGRRYSTTGAGNLAKVKTLMSKGYTVKDMRKAIAVKCMQWHDDPKMQDYMRPSTLLRPSHIDDYIGEWEFESHGE